MMRTISPQPSLVTPKQTVPATPAEEAADTPASKPLPHPEPTRFGDWEIHGKCIDF